jgi:hypothetical protein
MCLINETLRHEGVWGRECTDLNFLDFDFIAGERSASRPSRFIHCQRAAYEARLAADPVWTTRRRNYSWPYGRHYTDSLLKLYDIIIIIIIIIISCSFSGLEIENTAVEACRADHATLYPQTLALNSPGSGSRSVGIFRSRTKATELLLLLLLVVV